VELEDEDYDEAVERRLVNSQIWSIPQLAKNLLLMQKAMKEFGFSKGRPPKLVQVPAGMHCSCRPSAPSPEPVEGKVAAQLDCNPQACQTKP
jgi:hypothetical protein